MVCAFAFISSTERLSSFLLDLVTDVRVTVAVVVCCRGCSRRCCCRHHRCYCPSYISPITTAGAAASITTASVLQHHLLSDRVVLFTSPLLLKLSVFAAIRVIAQFVFEMVVFETAAAATTVWNFYTSAVDADVTDAIIAISKVKITVDNSSDGGRNTVTATTTITTTIALRNNNSIGGCGRGGS